MLMNISSSIVLLIAHGMASIFSKSLSIASKSLGHGGGYKKATTTAWLLLGVSVQPKMIGCFEILDGMYFMVFLIHLSFAH